MGTLKLMVTTSASAPIPLSQSSYYIIVPCSTPFVLDVRRWFLTLDINLQSPRSLSNLCTAKRDSEPVTVIDRSEQMRKRVCPFTRTRSVGLCRLVRTCFFQELRTFLRTQPLAVPTKGVIYGMVTQTATVTVFNFRSVKPEGKKIQHR